MSDKNTRPYVAQVFGQTFIVECAKVGQVETHLVKRLRDEITVRLATFEDGVEAANLGIDVEMYGEPEEEHGPETTSDLLAAGGVE